MLTSIVYGVLGTQMETQSCLVGTASKIQFLQLRSGVRIRYLPPRAGKHVGVAQHTENSGDSWDTAPEPAGCLSGKGQKYMVQQQTEQETTMAPSVNRKVLQAARN